MAQTLIDGLDQLRAREGSRLGTSNWHQVTQEQIDAFAAVTGDGYWIHTDPDRAAGSPFGSTIAHGLLTLGLGPMFTYEVFQITGVSMTVNYGFGKVRFPAPVPVGSRVRMHADLTGVVVVDGGATCTVVETFEREGAEKPVCVAEAMLRVIA